MRADLVDSLEETIPALAEAGARRDKRDCVECEMDALAGAINGVGGMSFILLFCYLLRRGGAAGGGGGGGSFGPTLRKIVDEYNDGGAGRHTACRHSAIRLFAVVILQGDPARFRAVVERMECMKEKASFWAAYVTKNDLYEEAFGAIWKCYGIFLNEMLLYNLGLGRAVDATFQHVALAYFYGFDQADCIFEKFVRKAKLDVIEGRLDAPAHNKGQSGRQGAWHGKGYKAIERGEIQPAWLGELVPAHPARQKDGDRAVSGILGAVPRHDQHADSARRRA